MDCVSFLKMNFPMEWFSFQWKWNQRNFGIGTKFLGSGQIFGIDSGAMWFIGDEQKLVISNYMLMKLPIIDYQIISRSHKFENSFVRDHLTAWYFIEDI